MQMHLMMSPKEVTVVVVHMVVSQQLKVGMQVPEWEHQIMQKWLRNCNFIMCYIMWEYIIVSSDATNIYIYIYIPWYPINSKYYILSGVCILNYIHFGKVWESAAGERNCAPRKIFKNNTRSFLIKTYYISKFISYYIYI